MAEDVQAQALLLRPVRNTNNNRPTTGAGPGPNANNGPPVQCPDPRFRSASNCKTIVDFGVGAVARREYKVKKNVDTGKNLISYVQEYGGTQIVAHMATMGLSTHRIYQVVFLFDTPEIVRSIDNDWPDETKLKHLPSLVQKLQDKEFAIEKVKIIY